MVLGTRLASPFPTPLLLDLPSRIHHGGWVHPVIRNACGWPVSRASSQLGNRSGPTSRTCLPGPVRLRRGEMRQLGDPRLDKHRVRVVLLALAHSLELAVAGVVASAWRGTAGASKGDVKLRVRVESAGLLPQSTWSNMTNGSDALRRCHDDDKKGNSLTAAALVVCATDGTVVVQGTLACAGQSMPHGVHSMPSVWTTSNLSSCRGAAGRAGTAGGIGAGPQTWLRATHRSCRPS